MSKRSLNLNRAVSCHTANQGLVGWWLGLPDNPPKDRLPDISYNKNDAIIGPPNGGGYQAKIRLDRTNTRFSSLLADSAQYNDVKAVATISNVSPLVLSGPLTISFWLHAFGSGYSGKILSLYDSTSSNAGIGLTYNNVIRNRFGIGITGLPLDTPGIYHVLYTQNGANGGYAYINGNLYSSTNSSSGDSGSKLDTVNLLSNPGYSGAYPGDLVGDLRISRLLSSPAQAFYLYQQRLRAYPDLLAYRSFVSFAKPSSGGTGITGTGSTTAGTTTTGTATVAIAGTAVTTAGTTSSGTAAVKIAGTAATTAGTTASGTGTVTITGTASTSAGTVTVGTGATVVGAVAVTTAGTTTTGTGTVKITGTGVTTAGTTTLASGNTTGTISPISGTAATTAGTTTTSTAAVIVAGTASTTAGSTSIGTGTIKISGTGTTSAITNTVAGGVVRITSTGTTNAGTVTVSTGTTGGGGGPTVDSNVYVFLLGA